MITNKFVYYLLLLIMVAVSSIKAQSPFGDIKDLGSSIEILLNNKKTKSNQIDKNLMLRYKKRSVHVSNNEIELSMFDDANIITIRLYDKDNVKEFTDEIDSSGSVEKLKLIHNDISHHIYPLGGSGLEWEIILNSKPKSNILKFPISVKEATFYRQDSLTAYEKQVMQAHRPDSVIGSYAVYQANRNYNGNKIKINNSDTTYLNYYTGKLFHIYRPKAWDSNLNRDTVWCDLYIDTLNNLLTVTIPEEYLFDTNRTYPIVVDPTIGNTNAGASQFNLGASFAEAVIGNYTHSASANETITSFHFYGWESGGDGSVSMSAYTMPVTTPVTRLAAAVSFSITATSDATKSWHTSAVVSQALTADTVYASACTEDSGSDVKSYFDSTPGVLNRQTSSSFTLDNPWSGGNKTNHVMSWYATTVIQSSGQYNFRRRISIEGEL